MKIRKVGAKRLPWLTADLIHKKRHIKFLNRKARTTNTTDAWSVYKKTKKQYNRQIKDTKCTYYRAKLHSNGLSSFPTNGLSSFQEISENDVLKLLHGLGPKKASGVDGISVSPLVS